MSTSTIVLLVIAGLAVVLAMYFLSIYNKLVKLRNRFENAFAQIEVQFQRRYDLIPNLVETAKGYMAHERETLEAVIQARNQAMAAMKLAEAAPGDLAATQGLAGAEGALAGALGRLFALAEAYPDLKANENMMQLSEELTSTENKVGFARQAYNDAVIYFNIARESFPDLIVANSFGFQEAALLELENEEARQAPKVSFS